MVASAIRAVFEQPDEASARDQCSRVIALFEPRTQAVARLLADADPDLLAHFTFPELHRARIRSTNPQERLNYEFFDERADKMYVGKSVALSCAACRNICALDDSARRAS